MRFSVAAVGNICDLGLRMARQDTGHKTRYTLALRTTVSAFDLLFVLESESALVKCSATRPRCVRSSRVSSAYVSVDWGGQGDSASVIELVQERGRLCDRLGRCAPSRTLWTGRTWEDSFAQPTMYIADRAMRSSEKRPNSTPCELPAGRGNYDRAGEK